MAKCKHKNSSWTGNVQIDLDSRGEKLFDTVKLIYTCCKCGKRILK